MTSRPLPAADECEKAVLSSLLQEPDSLMPEAQELGLTADAFSYPAYAKLFSLVSERLDKGHSCELIAMTQELMGTDLLNALGGAAGFTEVYTYASTSASMPHHISTMRNAYALRSVISECTDAVSRAYTHGADGMEVLSSTIAKLDCVIAGHDSVRTSKTKHIKDLLPSIKEKIRDRMEGKSTEWLPLSWSLIPLSRGGNIFVAARPGKGKTAFLENIGRHLAVEHNEPTCIISLEMTDEMMAERSLSGQSGVNTMHRSGLTKREIPMLQEADAMLCGSPFYISDMPGATVDEILVEMRKMRRMFGVKNFLIDYIQKIRGRNTAEITSKKLCVDLALEEIDAFRKKHKKDGMTLVFAAQSDRKADGLTAREMQMNLLAESSELEKIAFQVVFLGPRKDMDPSEDVLKMEAHVAKNRCGNTGSVPMLFHKETTTWIQGN